jgi:hypothetical protein
MNAPFAYVSGAMGHLAAEKLMEKLFACARWKSPSERRFSEGRTGEQNGCDDRWAPAMSPSNEARALGKTQRTEDPIVNRSHRAIFATPIEPAFKGSLGNHFFHRRLARPLPLQ